MKKLKLLLVLLGLLITGTVYSQDVYMKVGSKDSIQSIILNENRHLIVSLPKDYNTSNNTYPVLYVLDGNEEDLYNSLKVTSKLRVQMIIVAIVNTNRDRDMMPLSTPTYHVEDPGAERFLSFLEKELLPHIENKYRTNRQETILGQSLSGLFIMYAFLEKPHLFDNYIGNSAGWYADMDPFFSALVEKAFAEKDQFEGRKLFVANSLIDSYDPKKEVHNAMLEFSNKVTLELGDRVSFRYKTYDDYGHVPYPGFYDGLKYVLEIKE